MVIPLLYVFLDVASCTRDNKGIWIWIWLDSMIPCIAYHQEGFVQKMWSGRHSLLSRMHSDIVLVSLREWRHQMSWQPCHCVILHGFSCGVQVFLAADRPSTSQVEDGPSCRLSAYASFFGIIFRARPKVSCYIVLCQTFLHTEELIWRTISHSIIDSLLSNASKRGVASAVAAASNLQLILQGHHANSPLRMGKRSYTRP